MPSSADREPMPETPADVAALVEALHGRDLRGLADQFSFLAGVRPELFRPHQEHVVDKLLPRFEAGYDDLCVLLADAPDSCVDLLTRRLCNRWDSFDAGALAAIGTEAALAAVAE